MRTDNFQLTNSATHSLYIQSKTEDATFLVNSQDGPVLQRCGPRPWHMPGSEHAESLAVPWLDLSGSGAPLG